MNLSQRQLIIIAAIVLLVGGLVYLVASNSNKPPRDQQFSLSVWGADEKEVFEPLAAAYRLIRPGATITYKKIDSRNYEQTLVNALAAGDGPDVFYIGNHDIPAEKAKLSPAGRLFSRSDVSRLFPTVVEQDVVASGTQVYALPLYLDTLALIYNKDLFDQAGIVAPPKTWGEFLTDVPKLKIINQRGQIARAAAAIGGTEKTVDAGMDALILLMLQNGVRLTEDPISVQSITSPESADALAFYLQFSNPSSPAYTWNEDLTGSIDSFAAGKTAIILNYQSALAGIKRKNPFLNFAVSVVPQTARSDAAFSYPRYHALAVSKQSRIPEHAWDFVIQATTNTNLVRAYLGNSGRPPALRSLIGERISDPDAGVFAQSALIARSWYHADNAAIHEIFNDMVSSILTGRSSASDALSKTYGRMKPLYDKRNLNE